MRRLIQFMWLCALMITLGGCSANPLEQVDIRQYFGKTRSELIEMLGEPTGPDRVPQGMSADPHTLVYVRSMQQGGKRLPSTFERLLLTISSKGYCYEASGSTVGFDSPEAMLDALGVGGISRQVTKTTALGPDYKIPPFENVQIRRQWDKDPQYTRFIFDDRDAIDGPVKTN